MKNQAADAQQITREYLDRILIEERLLDSDVADTEMELWGEKFSSPIMTAALSHLKPYGEGRMSGLYEYAEAAREIGSVNFLGMSEDDTTAEVLGTGARTVKIIKPYADREKILHQIRFAEEHGAFAVGMDIDHSFGPDGYDVCLEEIMAEQTADDMKKYVSFTRLPFVVKGVLSVQDAVKCAEAGVSGIVVSHHAGRLPYAIPPLMVLPDIAAAVRSISDMKIFVDCGITYGADVFKALALGADAVCVGRAFLPDLEKKGTAGAAEYLNGMRKELAMIMAYTGAKTLGDIDASVLWDKVSGRRITG